MKSKTDDILKNAANGFELNTGPSSWNVVASALHRMERRGFVFQSVAFLSVFIGLMFFGKYLNPNETGNISSINKSVQFVSPWHPVLEEQLPSNEKRMATGPNHGSRPTSHPSSENNMELSTQEFVAPIAAELKPIREYTISLAARAIPLCETPKNLGSTKRHSLEVFTSIGAGYRNIFEPSANGLGSLTSAVQSYTPVHKSTTFVSLGATVSKRISKHWNLGTGLWLSKYGYAIYGSNSHFSSRLQYEGQYASYRIEVPLIADYKTNICGAKLELRQGLVPALMVAETSPLEDNYAQYSDNNTKPRMQVAALFNPRLKIRFGKTELLAGPEFRYSLTNSYPNKHLLSEHLWSASLNVGLRVKI